MNAALIPDKLGSTGPNVPRRGNFFTRWLGRTVLRLCGWKVVGNPPNEAKFVMTACPHTSNWDGFWFLCATFAIGWDLKFIAKDSLFKGWKGKMLTKMGGVSIDRSAAQDVVQQTAAEFAKRESLVLVLAPEGTRHLATSWKSGFYRMAVAANVPITLGFCDYVHKRVGFGPSFIPSGDYPTDVEKMLDFYRHVTPKYPEKYQLPEVVRDPGE